MRGTASIGPKSIVLGTAAPCYTTCQGFRGLHIQDMKLASFRLAPPTTLVIGQTTRPGM